MWYIVVFIATAILGMSGFFLLKRRRIYSVLLLVLSFYGVSFLYSYKNLELNDELSAGRAALVFSIGSVTLLTSLIFLELLFHPVLRKSTIVWNRNLRHYSDQHLFYSSIFLTLGILINLIFRPDFNSNWEASRADVSSALIIFAPFLMFLGCPAVVSAIRFSKFMFSLLLLAVLTIFILSGSRAGVLTIMGFFLWNWLSMRNSTKISFRTLAGLSIIAIIALSIHAILRGIRSFSPSEILSILSGLDIENIITAILLASSEGGLAGSESSITHYLVFSARSAYESDYGFLTSVKRILTLMLPSTLFPEKPIDVTYQLWENAFVKGLFDESLYYSFLLKDYTDGVMGSLHPTVFGEFFLSGNWISLIISLIFLSCTCVAVDIILLKLRPVNSLLLLGPSIVGMAMIGRGNSVIGVGYFAYLLPIVILTTYSLGFIFPKKSERRLNFESCLVR